MSWKIIGNTSYNVEAVKEMKLSEFKKLYKSSLGNNAELMYYKITGKKKPKKKDQED